MIATHDPIEFIADPPAGMALLVLVDPAELAALVAAASLMIDGQPATQAAIDALVKLADAGAPRA